MSFNSYIFMILLVSSTLSTCGDGCLKCGADNACLVCNFQRGWSLNQGTCVKSIDTRCFTTGPDGLCQICNKGYRLDTTSKKCVKSSNTITNCLYYNEFGNCQYCRNGFYPLDNTCAKVLTTISNCLYYKDSTKCDVC